MLITKRVFTPLINHKLSVNGEHRDAGGAELPLGVLSMLLSYLPLGLTRWHYFSVSLRSMVGFLRGPCGTTAFRTQSPRFADSEPHL